MRQLNQRTMVYLECKNLGSNKMDNLIIEYNNQIAHITLNRIDKHNAFDDILIQSLQKSLDNAILDPNIQVILLKANGKHFSTGADLDWMQRMASCSESENTEDALKLAKLLYTLHNCPKPTIAMVQGSAYGGGAGLVAACDIAIAGSGANFCFSEVKLGLIPAVISPYVIKAIGERAAKWLFISAESINAQRAQSLGLVHHCVDDQTLSDFCQKYAERLLLNAEKAMTESKYLVDKVSGQAINDDLLLMTAELIAKKRGSAEAQTRLVAFLRK